MAVIRSTLWLRLGSLLFLGLVLLLLTALWHWTPAGRALDPDNLIRWGQALTQHPWGPPVLLAAFGLGSLLAFPITLLILATGMLYSPALAVLYAQCGIALGATLTFYLGRWLGRGTVDRFLGPRLAAMIGRLARRGLLTVVVLRNMPVGSFTLVNMALGTTPIRFRDYLAGTLIGMLPLTLLLTLFADGLTQAAAEPGPGKFLWLGAMALLLVAGLLLLRRWAREEA